MYRKLRYLHIKTDFKCRKLLVFELTSQDKLQYCLSGFVSFYLVYDTFVPLKCQLYSIYI